MIAPAIAEASAAGIDASGPYPADTLFMPQRLEGADAVLAMYHDQGLPVLKHASFGSGVNVTLGLPIVRTSVDHGTALDLAGTGRVDPGSLIEARRSLPSQLASAPRKRFGQHFLTDRHYLARIVEAIAPARGRLHGRDRPGPGALTAPLLEQGGNLHVVEIDRDLAAGLREPLLPNAHGARRRRARVRLRAAARAAARGGQPALQRLDADPVPSSRATRRSARLHLHAAEGGGRAHGGRARRRTTGGSR